MIPYCLRISFADSSVITLCLLEMILSNISLTPLSLFINLQEKKAGLVSN
jgi:hypothetical protein